MTNETGAVLSKRRILAQSGTTLVPHLVVGRAAAIMLLTIAGVVAAFAFAPDSLAIIQKTQGAVMPVAAPLFNQYLLAFEVTSVLLLVAIVGAVVIGRRRGEFLGGPRDAR